MHVFFTGGTGHTGSYIVPELIAAGHEVTGLARSDTSAAALSALGAKVRRGDRRDLEGLKEAARTPTESSTSHTGRTCCRPAGSPPSPQRRSRSCSPTAKHSREPESRWSWRGASARPGTWADPPPRRTPPSTSTTSTREPCGHATSWRPPSSDSPGRERGLRSCGSPISRTAPPLRPDSSCS